MTKKYSLKMKNCLKILQISKNKEDLSEKAYQNIKILIYFLKDTIRHGGRGTKNVPRDPVIWRETTKVPHIHGN